MKNRTLHQEIDAAVQGIWKDSEYRESYARSLKKIVKDIKLSDAGLLAKTLSPGGHPSTWNRKMNLLGGVLTAAGLSVKLPRMLVEESDRMSLTEAELTAVSLWYRNNAGFGQYTLFVFHRDTGARPGSEARHFDLSKWRKEDRDITLRSKKGGKGFITRKVPATDELSSCLSILQAQGKRLDPTLTKSWNKMREALFPNQCLPPYTLRHTYAMRLLTAGVPIHVVSRLMGHRSLETTMLYTRYTPDDRNSVLSILNSNEVL
jgi:hypothetical protein